MAYKKKLDPIAHDIIKMSEEIIGKNPMSNCFVITEENYHRKYDDGRTGPHSGKRWDCSELASAIIMSTNKGMENMGIKWNTDFSHINEAFKLHSTTRYQEDILKKVSPLISNKKEEIKEMLAPGMTVFMDYGKGRHIGVVTKDPKTGELLIAESFKGSNNIGVVHRSVKDFFGLGQAKKPSTKFTLYDPYHLDREKLNELNLKEENVRVAYLEAEKILKNPLSGIAESVVKDEHLFIKKYIKEKIEKDNGNFLNLAKDKIAHIDDVFKKETDLNNDSLENRIKQFSQDLSTNLTDFKLAKYIGGSKNNYIENEFLINNNNNNNNNNSSSSNINVNEKKEINKVNISNIGSSGNIKEIRSEIEPINISDIENKKHSNNQNKVEKIDFEFIDISKLNKEEKRAFEEVNIDDYVNGVKIIPK